MTTLSLVVILLFAIPLFAQRPKAVRPYVKRNGTYVQRHYRTTPNRTRVDNYSTKGNRNTFTGKKGYRPSVKPPKLRSLRRPSQ